MTPRAWRQHAGRPRAAGFSLIELMISVALGLVVLAVLAMIFANTTRARAELQRSSQQIDNGRAAVDLLTEDLQLAGYFGELNLSGITLPTALPDLCAFDAAAWAAAMPIHMQGYDAGADAPACMPTSLKGGTDIVALRRVRTCFADAAGCEALVDTQPYLQVSLCGSAGNAYTLGIAADSAFPHKLKDCTTAAGRRRYETHVYFISNDNGAGYTEVALVEGIERVEIEYGIDTDGDGSPDAYTPDPTSYTYAGCTACSAAQNWSNVVTAKLHVLSRALEVSPGYVDLKTYSLGANAEGQPLSVGPFKDGYRRHVYSAAVRIMNPSAKRDVP